MVVEMDMPSNGFMICGLLLRSLRYGRLSGYLTQLYMRMKEKLSIPMIARSELFLDKSHTRTLVQELQKLVYLKTLSKKAEKHTVKGAETESQ